jgi:hypothetical protein
MLAVLLSSYRAIENRPIPDIFLRATTRVSCSKMVSKLSVVITKYHSDRKKGCSPSEVAHLDASWIDAHCFHTWHIVSN